VLKKVGREEVVVCWSEFDLNCSASQAGNAPHSTPPLVWRGCKFVSITKPEQGHEANYKESSLFFYARVAIIEFWYRGICLLRTSLEEEQN
jgi:hypothetical protein